MQGNNTDDEQVPRSEPSKHAGKLDVRKIKLFS